MKHLRNMLDGMASVLGSMSSTRSYVTNFGGFEKDAKSLSGDVRTVSRDIKKQSETAYGTLTASKSKKR